MGATGDRFERAVEIMARLRAPGGCPWDREQTFDTIKPFTLEETYEVLEAIDNRDWDELREETDELKQEVAKLPQPPKPQHRGVAGAGSAPLADEMRVRLEDELGDMFFVLVNIARYLALDPESALRKTNRKFKWRFQWLE